MKKITAIMIVILSCFTSSIFASNSVSLINEEDAPVQFFAEYEQGFIDILSHNIQTGGDGDNFNYVTQGGQDILFPFERINVGAVINDRHRISFLYQPLEINTVVPFQNSVTVDGKEIDGVVELKYSFPFWRFTYSYDVLNRKDMTLGFGAALQIRNASIIFKEVDGTADDNGDYVASEASVSQNVGPVPALNIYYMWETPVGINISADITGLYASSAIINGASFDFEGSILDASIRTGYRLKHNMELFANLRFFGGTSKGTSSYDGSNWSVSSGGSTRYGENNIATLTATLGFTIR
jgi:hypothetical protein